MKIQTCLFCLQVYSIYHIIMFSSPFPFSFHRICMKIANKRTKKKMCTIFFLCNTKVTNVYITIIFLYVLCSKLVKAAYAESKSKRNCLTCDSVNSSDACIAFNVLNHVVTFSFPSKFSDINDKRFMVSTKSRNSGCSSTIAFIPNRNLSISVMNSETISAIHLLVLPLSSLMVIGRSSLMRSNAAGQSKRNFLTNASTVC